MPKQTFRQKFEELEKLAAWFEGDDVDLEDALKKFEHGLGLVSELKEHLKNIENKVVEIQKSVR